MKYGNGFAAFPFIISDIEHAGGTSSAGKDSRRMKKKAALLPLLLGFGIMFTACGANNAQNGNDQNGQNGQSAGSSANSDTNGGANTTVNSTTGTSPGNGNGSVIGDNNARTGDVDGDGIIEDIVTGAEDVVNGVARGADNILEDITPGERDNATQTTTANR